MGDLTSIIISNRTFSSFTVVDLSGRSIDPVAEISTKDGSHSISWNTSELTAGIYFINILNNEGVKQVIKVIK